MRSLTRRMMCRAAYYTICARARWSFRSSTEKRAAAVAVAATAANLRRFPTDKTAVYCPLTCLANSIEKPVRGQHRKTCVVQCYSKWWHAYCIALMRRTFFSPLPYPSCPPSPFLPLPLPHRPFPPPSPAAPRLLKMYIINCFCSSSFIVNLASSKQQSSSQQLTSCKSATSQHPPSQQTADSTLSASDQHNQHLASQHAKAAC